MNILEIAVAVYLLFCLWNGYRLGLIRMVFSMVALVVTIIFSVVVSPYISKALIGNSVIYSAIQGKMYDYVEEFVDEKAGGVLSARSDEMWVIDNLPLPHSIRTNMVNNNNEIMYDILNVESFQDYASHYLAGIMINAISFIAVFILAQVLVQIVIRALDLVSKLPGINSVNHMAGLLAAGLKAILFLWVLCLLATAIGSTDAGQTVLGMIKDSMFLSLIYNNNYLVYWVGNLFQMLG